MRAIVRHVLCIFVRFPVGSNEWAKNVLRRQPAIGRAKTGGCLSWAFIFLLEAQGSTNH